MELGKQCYFYFHAVKDIQVEVTVKFDIFVMTLNTGNLLKN